jgi:hypothetical protein
MRSILLLIVMLFLGAALGGCSLVAPLTGNAAYSYTEWDSRTGKKTCKLTVNSGRESTGVNAKACNEGLEVTATEVNQGNSTADMGLMLNSLLGVIQAAKAPAPAASPAPPALLAPAASPNDVDFLSGSKPPGG